MAKSGEEPLAGTAPDLARFEGGRVAAAVPELNARETAVPVRDLAHVAQVHDIALIPDARRRVGIFVRLGVDGAVFGEHHAPAALGLHTAQMRLRARPLGARAGAVRGLPKAIAGFFWSDLDRVEQHIVLWISSHGLPPKPRAPSGVRCR